MAKKKRIYCINRYDSNKLRQVRKNSGYEQVVKYSDNFVSVKPSLFLSKVLLKLLRKKVPADYIGITIAEEFILFFKALISGHPVFYLYADKDAFLLPILKRKFRLNRIKLYGTLHWPTEISRNVSFHKYNLASTFNGIITLSSGLAKLPFQNVAVIPHGIETSYWKNTNHNDFDNYYLIIGVSNRDHERQVEIIKTISDIDPSANFKIVISQKTVRQHYKSLNNVEIFKKRISDNDLKHLYSRAKAVVLFQKYCLASNVILEALAMGVPVITNNIGDVTEYLGKNYPLFIDNEDDYAKLKKMATSNTYRNELVSYLLSIREEFSWPEITLKTEAFIK